MARTRGRLLHDPRGGSFRFDAGAACLDFAHSGGEGVYAVFERLHEPADLAAWLAEPPLAAAVTVPVTPAELAAAKALRRAIWDAAHARAAGRAVPRAAVAALNAAAAALPLVPRLTADGTRSEWAPPVSATQALSTLAREMIALLSGPAAPRIPASPGEDAPLVCVHTSRPGTRRGCGRERCGNRHKLRAPRARRAAGGGARAADAAGAAEG